MALTKTTTSRRSMMPRTLVTRIRRKSSSVKDTRVITQETPDDASSLPDEDSFYPTSVASIRQEEYPHMSQGTYLDHGGTTIYAKSLITSFAQNLTANLYGNPHSSSSSSSSTTATTTGPAERSGDLISLVRRKTLAFFGADPAHFDLVFVANATAAIKLVADSFRDLAQDSSSSGSFWYGFHKDAHTSLVGVRELTAGTHNHHCFASDEEVEAWLREPGQVMNSDNKENLALFAYPAQSNLSGRRLPLSWPARIRRSPVLGRTTYTLLDAAALAMTSSLQQHGVFSEDPAAAAPDFTCVSLYKIFGFPDLGALIVRRDSGHILTLRKYFGGGTVTMVSVLGNGGAWHKVKGRDVPMAAVDDSRGGSSSSSSRYYDIHDALEDGTLPFHSIIALGEAIDTHARLYGSMENISRHTTRLSVRLYQKLRSLKHGNGRPLCRIYAEDGSFGDPKRQGATIAFNVLDSDGQYVAYSDVERLATENRIYIRSGAICCPGGVFTALEYEPWHLKRAMSAHHTCGPDGISLIHQVPTGVVRASVGAMTTEDDVETFISFLQRCFMVRNHLTIEKDDGSSETSLGSAAPVASIISSAG